MDLQLILMTVIAFSAVISVLSAVFYALLNPVKDNQARFKAKLKEIRSDIADIKKFLYQTKNQ